MNYTMSSRRRGCLTKLGPVPHVGRLMLTFVCVWLGIGYTVSAQQPATATLGGRILDPNGAVVPDASVTVTQRTTGLIRQTTSNAEGLYVVSNLQPGDYDVNVEAKGFATKATKLPITVRIGQTLSADFTLEITVRAEAVVDFVSGSMPINTETSVVDGVIS